MTSSPCGLSRIGVAALLLIGPLASARAAAISGNGWFPIGPAPAWGMFPGGVAGRASALAVNPMNASDLWLGTAGGGVWHSIDGGANWTPMTDDRESLAIGAIALDGCTVSGCNTVFAGTGENAFRRDTYRGAGLLVGFRRTNGYDWVLRDGGGLYKFAGGSIYNVLVDHGVISTAIYITLARGETASASESSVTAPEPSPGGYGIYKSTNNGIFWTKLVVPGAEGSVPTDLEMHPALNSILYAGFEGRGIFRSMDYGATWCPLNPGVPRPQGCGQAAQTLPTPASGFDHVEITIDPNNSSHLYASFGRCTDRHVADCEPSIFESSDLGVTWGLRWAGDSGPRCTSPNTQCDPVACPRVYSRYTHGLTVDPFLPNKLYLGGIRLCRSMNNGQNWGAVDVNNKDYPGLHRHTTHFDHRAIVFHRTNHNLAWDLNDGGIAASTNGGQSWTPINGQGFALQTLEFQSITTSPLTARVIGGAQDNDGLMWLGSDQWKQMGCCGDGGFAVMGPTYANDLWITSNSGPLNSVVVVPQRSVDGGATWQDPDGSADPYNQGLPSTDPRSFYPPMVRGGQTLYFGTQALYRSFNAATVWTAMSPDLCSGPQPENWTGEDVMTAIALAPSDPNRIFVGCFSGKVFATDTAGDATPSWYEMDVGLPAAPITSLAVDPVDRDIVYATLSGFFPGIHVYGHHAGFIKWFPLGGIAALNGVPANSIAVEPDDRRRLWLGTDIGVFRSLNAGGWWATPGPGLPRVPVFQVVIDAMRDRVFAATHGRGAYILSQPAISSFQGCADGGVQDVPISGLGFFPNAANCGVWLVRQDGSICAFDTTDVLGGSIRSDDKGRLITAKPPYFSQIPTVWACKGGKCLGGSSVATCHQPNNPLSTAVAICAPLPRPAFTTINGCPPLSVPPSSVLLFGGFPDSLTDGRDAAAEATEPGDAADAHLKDAGSGSGSLACVDPQLTTSGSFTLIPSLQSGDGSSRFLCSVSVPFSSADTPSVIVERAAGVVNGAAACQVSGVTARVQPPSGDQVEDDFASPGSLSLVAPGATGGQLITSLRAAPGQATGACVTVDSLGVPVNDEIRRMKVRFETGMAGAQGGEVTITETTSLGECSIVVPTSAGSSAASLASAIEAAFQAPGIPGPHEGCPSSSNPRDVEAHGDAIAVALASRIDVCSNDAGVGFAVSPQELCFGAADCDDANPCTVDACSATEGRCAHTPTPDGLACEDNDPCTLGNACVSGACGTPAACGDANPCTADSCAPATGGCVHVPVACNDFDPCTTDSCNVDTGRCFFSSIAGAACDDGSLCTAGDTCMMVAGSGVKCQGYDACDDGNLCTADLCDPATGACTNQAIQCEDGNPCTVDFCDEGGSCASAAITGAPCDDADRCTTGDTCVAGPPGTDPDCQGQPAACDDSDACTVDGCDPVTGGCVHAPVALAEAAGLHFTNPTTLAWQGSGGAVYWNTYRGTIPADTFGGRPPGQPLYDHTCFEMDDQHGDGPTVAIDAALPSSGTAFYYFVSMHASCGESPLGTDSNGTAVPNPAPCPMP